MNLKEAMVAKGASDAMLSSKTLKMAETIMAEDAGVVSETANEYAQMLLAELKKARTEYMQLNGNLKNMGYELNDMKSCVEEVYGAVNNFVDANKQKVVEDPRTKDAILAYQQMLTITQSIFGEENMTEAVMIKTIEAGSYCFWRSVMGGKFENNKDMFDDVRSGRQRIGRV